MWTLKAIRNNKNWTMEEASKRYGVSVDSLRNYETYRTYPTSETIFKILEAIDMKYDDVIFFKETLPPNGNI